MGWYKPAGQFVVIDSSTGDWAAMSAITRFENADHAYNLFTGVDPRYRGRKLGQAVKSLALCYARDQLGVDKVRTNHDADNAPMIAIDRQLGYVQVPGTCRMEKTLKGKE
jgi:RimJ/RimL family protein N-acetyltransferase